MVGKLASNSTHFTRVLVKDIPGRVFFLAAFSQNGDKIETSLPPPYVERLLVVVPISVELLATQAVPVDLLELHAGAVEEGRVDFVVLEHTAHELLSEKAVAIHSFRHDARHLRRRELHKRISLGYDEGRL